MKTDPTRELMSISVRIAKIAISTQHKLSILESVVEEELPRLYLAYRETLAAHPEPTLSLEEVEARLTEAA
jgi:hypothetical protein